MQVKGVQRFKDRHGKWRQYHRKTGKPIAAEWGTPEFLREVEVLNGAVAQRLAAKGGTLKEVFDEYRTMPAWTKDIAPATRKGYEKYFAVVPFMHGWPIKLINSARLAGVRDKISTKRGARSANYVLSTLSVIFGFAIERGYVKDNPVKLIRRSKRERTLKKANRPWAIEEAQAVIDRAPWSIRVPVAIAMYTGLRKADVLSLEKAKRRGNAIHTSKTDEEVIILLHPELVAILEAAPEHEAPTLAVNSRGESWTSSGFDSSWDKFKGRLEKEKVVDPDLTIHGLRHTVGNLLAEAGCDLDTIRRVLGQKTLTMAQLYSERAKKRQATREAVERLDPRGTQGPRAPEGEEAGPPP